MARPFLSTEQLAEQAGDFARCRTLRHGWEPIGSGDRRPAFGDQICLRCVFCGTLRYDKFSRITGERIAPPTYDYPPGYRDADKHSHAWWRATWADGLADLIVSGEDELAPKRGTRTG